MHEGLAGHRQKLTHAIDHIHDVHAAAERYAQTDPCSVRMDCERETRKHRVFIEVEQQPTDPLLRLRLGDAVHCMRQGLDHLAYQLAIVVQAGDPPRNWRSTGFRSATNRGASGQGCPVALGTFSRCPRTSTRS